MPDKTVWKCFALNSGMSVSLLHLNIWRVLLLLSSVCLCVFSFDQEEAVCSCGIKVLQTNIYFAEIDKAFL